MSGDFLARIYDDLFESAKSRKISDVRIGLGYTAVMLDSGSVGLAYTFRADAPGGCNVFKGKRPLAGSSASDLIKYLGSDDKIETAVALAAANALVADSRQVHLTGDILEHLKLSPEDRVGMVGYFGPLLPELKRRCREVLVFEEADRGVQHLLSSGSAQEALFSCQVAMVTATTLINGSFSSLVQSLDGCRDVVLLGPSTPIMPFVFADSPVTILSGVRVRNPQAVLQVVSEGGGMAQFKTYVEKVNVRVSVLAKP